MTDYTKSAASADRMLKKAGGGVTLRRTVLGEYDPETGTAPSTTIDYPGIGCKFGYESSLIDGTLILQGDQELYLSTKQTNGQAMPAPVAGDLVMIGATVYSVKSAGKVEPTDVPVLYTAQLRGV